MMKNVLWIIALCLPTGLRAAEITPFASDTTIQVDDKRIEISNTDDRMKVRVYEVTEEGREIDDEMVFEGHYKDGRTYEKRKHNAITIPLPNWRNKDFDAHWAGFGMGFANFADADLHLNDIDGVSLRSGKSLEYNLNFFEKSFPFSRYNWGLVTGMGMRWSRYRVDGNQYFKEVDGITSLIPTDKGLHLSSSKLNITSLTIPLLFEWQNRKRWDSDFFVSFGVVGVVKTTSSSKIVYKDTSGKRHKEKVDGGMNLRPVTMDFLFQAGYDWIGMYMKYSPIGLFEGGKGPKVHPVSIGLQLHI